MSWFVYIVECSDNSLYTGISTDVKARIKKHNSGKGDTQPILLHTGYKVLQVYQKKQCAKNAHCFFRRNIQRIELQSH